MNNYAMLALTACITCTFVNVQLQGHKGRYKRKSGGVRTGVRTVFVLMNVIKQGGSETLCVRVVSGEVSGCSNRGLKTRC